MKRKEISKAETIEEEKQTNVISASYLKVSNY